MVWWRKRRTVRTASGRGRSAGRSTGTTTRPQAPPSGPPARTKCLSAPAQSNAAHAATARLAKDLGATHYRYAFEIGWGLEALDSVVTTCRNLGLKIVLCVFRADRIIPTDDPGRAAFASTCRDLIARAGPIVTHLEVWNEPNHRPFVTVQDPAAYARLMIATHALIKTTFGSTVTTITGGLSPEPSPYAPHEFWAACCATDPRFVTSFDLAGIHPYCFPHSPLGTESWNALAQTVTLWKDTAAKYGRTIEFAATEYGAPSAWTTTYLGTSVTFDESRQAQWYRDYLTAFTTRGPVFRLVSPFMPIDSNVGGTWEPTTGLYRQDLTEKPAAAVWRAQ